MPALGCVLLWYPSNSEATPLAAGGELAEALPGQSRELAAPVSPVWGDVVGLCLVLR